MGEERDSPIDPTARALDAAREFLTGISFVATVEVPAGLVIVIPIMGPDDHLINYTVDAQGNVTQHVGPQVAAGGVPEGSTGTNTEPGEIAPPAVDVVTLNGSVFDMLNQVADAEERDRRG